MSGEWVLNECQFDCPIEKRTKLLAGHRACVVARLGDYWWVKQMHATYRHLQRHAVPMFCLYVRLNSARFVADLCAVSRFSQSRVSASFDSNVTCRAPQRSAPQGAQCVSTVKLARMHHCLSVSVCVGVSASISASMPGSSCGSDGSDGSGGSGVQGWQGDASRSQLQMTARKGHRSSFRRSHVAVAAVLLLCTPRMNGAHALLGRSTVRQSGSRKGNRRAAAARVRTV
jgi:hypothetical protein